MHISNEKKLEARATELGNSACAEAFGELEELVGSESPLVRRLAASVLGKLAEIVPAGPAVKALHPLLQDGHPQVRQYSAKAHLNRRIQNKEFRIPKCPSGGFFLRDSTFLVLCSSFTGGQTCLDRGALYPADKPHMRDALLDKLEKLK